MARFLFVPALLAILVVNLIPLYGVLWWDWDTFQLLMLYWIETVVIAFWTICRLARLPEEEQRNAQRNPAAFGLAGFFALHAGIFITVHFVFLWAFFSYDWFKKVHGIGGFFYQLVIANGIWVAILLMLIVHSVSFFAEREPTARASGDRVMPIIGGLYARIVIMQIAILAGAWFSGFTGSLAPLVIVIALKTLFDLGLGAYTPLRALLVDRAAAGNR
jgi:hypothetical protein